MLHHHLEHRAHRLLAKQALSHGGVGVVQLQDMDTRAKGSMINAGRMGSFPNRRSAMVVSGSCSCEGERLRGGQVGE